MELLVTSYGLSVGYLCVANKVNLLLTGIFTLEALNKENMGTPDSVSGKCPRCRRKVFFQTKSGPNTLSVFPLETAPEDVMRDVNRHSPIQCECGARLVVVDSSHNGRKIYAVK